MLIQGCGLGKAGLQQQARLEEVPVLFEQLDSTEQVRRHDYFCLQPRPGASADNVQPHSGADHATSDWEC